MPLFFLCHLLATSTDPCPLQRSRNSLSFSLCNLSLSNHVQEKAFVGWDIFGQCFHISIVGCTDTTENMSTELILSTIVHSYSKESDCAL